MKQYVCSVCGYLHTGDACPDRCPVCGAGKGAFSVAEEKETKSLQEYIDAQINGEAWEVVHYLGVAMLAESLGYADVAQVIRRIATEEAEHGANYLFRSGAAGKELKDLQGFVSRMIDAEKGACAMKAEGASLALAEKKEELAGLFKTSSEDERRHAEMWTWCKKQLEK